MVIRFLGIKLIGLLTITYEHRNLKIKPLFNGKNTLDDLYQTFYSTLTLNAKYRFKSCHLSINRKKGGMPDCEISF